MMGWLSQASIFGVILFIAGAGIPLMAAVNADLGVRLGSPIPAVFVLFLLAFAITAVLTLTNPLPSKAEFVAIPPHYYLGGLFVAFYVLSITCSPENWPRKCDIYCPFWAIGRRGNNRSFWVVKCIQGSNYNRSHRWNWSDGNRHIPCKKADS